MAKSEWIHVFPFNLFREGDGLGGWVSSQGSLKTCGPANSQRGLPAPGRPELSLKWEVSRRKARTGPLLGSVITAVGPVWTPVEACDTEKKLCLVSIPSVSYFQPKNRHPNRVSYLKQLLFTKSSRCLLTFQRREKEKELMSSIKPEALLTEITSCPRQALSHSLIPSLF